jgi:hypothetical protein
VRRRRGIKREVFADIEKASRKPDGVGSFTLGPQRSCIGSEV